MIETHPRTVLPAPVAQTADAGSPGMNIKVGAVALTLFVATLIGIATPRLLLAWRRRHGSAPAKDSTNVVPCVRPSPFVTGQRVSGTRPLTDVR